MAQQAFGFRAGYPRTDGFAVSFISLSNADITINCNGFTKTLTASDWQEVGTDHPTLARLGYMVSTVVTGQSVFVRHSYTVTQSGVTYSGSAMTAPVDATADFTLFFNTCDNNIFQSDPVGAYKPMVDYLDAGNTVLGLVHVDDHYGYPDLACLSDNGTGGTGHESTLYGTAAPARDSGLEYNYAMAWFASFGLFVNDVGNGDQTWTNQQFGHNLTRIRAMRELNCIPQWGDHDAGDNEMGWDEDPTDTNGVVSPQDRFTSARRLWDLFMKPLAPPSISSEVNADGVECLAWGTTLGAVTMVAPDGITLGSGDATNNFAVDGFGPTTVYGNTQIDDCLTAFNTDAPFKLNIAQMSVKFMSAGDKFLAGAQNPLKNGRPAEFQRFFTESGNTIKSIMDNPKTNGQWGTYLSLHGDKHTNSIYRHQDVAFTGNLAEGFYSISVGTVNGSVNFGDDGTLIAGKVFDGSTIEVYESARKGQPQGTPIQGLNHWWNLRLDVKGSVHPPELHVIDDDRFGNTIWEKKFVQYRGGNSAFTLTDNISAKVFSVLDRSDDG